jgi:hypothetical protein
MQLVLSDKIVLEIKASLPRPSFFAKFGEVSAYICLEGPAPTGAGLPFYERRKWQADIAIERQWWIGRLAASLSTPRYAGSKLMRKKFSLSARTMLLQLNRHTIFAIYGMPSEPRPTSAPWYEHRRSGPSHLFWFGRLAVTFE